MNSALQLLLVISFFQNAMADEEAWRYQWKDKSLDMIASLNSDSDSELMMKVGRLAALKGRDAKVSSLSAEVANAATVKILSIPNHASYFEEEIRRFDELERSYHEDKIHELANSGYHRSMTFRTLEHLPSPQVVELLGKFLDDPTLPWHTRKPMPGAAPYGSNAEMAARTLGSLPIANPPVTSPPRNPQETQDNIEQWKIWRDHIKEGSRTFRFEGDPMSYNFKGVVWKPDGPSRPSRRDRSTAAEPTLEVTTPTRNWWPAIFALLVLLAASIWLVRSKTSA